MADTIGQAGPATRIVPGHGPVVDRSAVIAHRDMVVAVRDKVARMAQQGLTLDQVAERRGQCRLA